MSRKEIDQGQGINRHVPQVPEGAERSTSPPPELYHINSQVVSESKYSLGGQGGQGRASSSGPQGRQGGPLWTDEQSQLTGAVTSGKEGQHEIKSALPDIADRNAASSSSPRLNANYRAQASNEIRIKKINYPVGAWNDNNGRLEGFFNVTRSDDSKVLLDNRFLREKYPQLLVDFYEQHLNFHDNI